MTVIDQGSFEVKDAAHGHCQIVLHHCVLTVGVATLVIRSELHDPKGFLQVLGKALLTPNPPVIFLFLVNG